MSAGPIKFYRTPVDRHLFAALRERSDIRGLIQSVGLLLCFTVGVLVSWRFYQLKLWGAMIAAAYVHSMLASFAGTESTVHELSHGTPFRTRWLNELFYGLFSFLSWSNPVHFRESHRRHHQHTLFTGLDKEVIIEPAPFHASDYISWFLFDWKKFRMLMRANLAFSLGRDQPDVFFWDPLFERTDPKRARMVLWARLQLLGHAVIIALCIYYRQYILIYTISLSGFFATFLGHSTGMVQHTGLRSNVPDHRMSCHTTIFGPFMSFLYWNMNYHIEHHMYASIPFFSLRALHHVMADDLPEPVIGYLPAVRTILAINRRQRREPGWWLVPELPPTAAPAKEPLDRQAVPKVGPDASEERMEPRSG